MEKNKVRIMKTAAVLLLISALVFALCSCKKEAEEVTTTAAATAAYTAPAETTETTTAAETTWATTAAATTQAPTQTEAPTEAPDVAGIETVTDGNKTIVYPLNVKYSQKTYPVIAWANGTSCPTQSYTGLLEALANGGYIVIADSDTMTADGTSQIDSVNYMLNQNANPSSVFYNKVNTSAIGLCGHSQGGRSCVNAAQKDSRVRAIVSIAGASSTDEARGLRTPSLFLTGTNDLVVVSSRWCKPSYDAVSGRAAYASLKGGIHTTCMTNPERVSGYTLDWFNAYLKNDSAARAVFENGGKLSGDSNWQDFQNKN